MAVHNKQAALAKNISIRRNTLQIQKQCQFKKDIWKKDAKTNTLTANAEMAQNKKHKPLKKQNANRKNAAYLVNTAEVPQAYRRSAK